MVDGNEMVGAMHIIKRIVIFIFTVLSLIGCDAENSPDKNEGSLNCADAIAYDEPLLDVQSITNSETGEALAQATFSELRINEREIRFDFLDKSHMYNVNISSDGQSAVCTLPCGLFTSEGEYSMRVSAPNYASKRVEFEASYDNVDYERCPTTYYGNRELNVDLIPFDVVSCPATSGHTLLGEDDVHKSLETVIDDAHEFRELYATIDPNNQDDIPSIDFEENRAVFIYMGQQTNTYSEIRLDEVVSTDEGITVKYENVQPSESCATDSALSEPYCIIALPNTDEPVLFLSTVVEECARPRLPEEVVTY